MDVFRYSMARACAQVVSYFSNVHNVPLFKLSSRKYERVVPIPKLSQGLRHWFIHRAVLGFPFDSISVLNISPGLRKDEKFLIAQITKASANLLLCSTLTPLTSTRLTSDSPQHWVRPTQSGRAWRRSPCLSTPAHMIPGRENSRKARAFSANGTTRAMGIGRRQRPARKIKEVSRLVLLVESLVARILRRAVVAGPFCKHFWTYWGDMMLNKMLSRYCSAEHQKVWLRHFASLVADECAIKVHWKDVHKKQCSRKYLKKWYRSISSPMLVYHSYTKQSIIYVYRILFPYNASMNNHSPAPSRWPLRPSRSILQLSKRLILHLLNVLEAIRAATCGYTKINDLLDFKSNRFHNQTCRPLKYSRDMTTVLNN